MHKYRILGKKGEGTFSEVLKCQHIKDGTYYACKKMKQTYDSLEQVNNLREIQAMRRLSPHENILELIEVIFDKKTGTLALLCELMDMNIYELIRGRRHYLAEMKVKSYMYQLLKSLDHMHRNGIFHRDVKPENILIKDDLLKLADFGSCRSVYSKQPYTEYISTRWYRAPECLLTDGYYTYKMDLWSVGCVFFEVMSLHPLFPGANEVDQIAKIHDIMGTPDASILNKLRNKTRGMNFNFPPKKGSGIQKLLPHASPESIELMFQLCTYDPDERISAKQALRHPYFKDLREADKRKHQQATSKKAEEESGKMSPNSMEETHAKTTNNNHIITTKEVDATYQPQQRRRRKPRRFQETDKTYHTTLLPKVAQSNQLTTSNVTSFPTMSSFPSSTFPKLHTGPSMLPSIANTHYNKHHQHTKKSTSFQEPTKSMYGHYQLPSIHKGKGTQF
ncbi:MAPK/MAK/MRK overlapping kinase-like isoform X2 [Acanthaster planci]|uniref:MAPK/MAK/MRK overlapping kinase-like isoform X2 n=1 Tax=Acanthaster planci TaxID=133434 RepID=A0A8B7YBH9_ACAPL|nr:MAPK/MAK/MRK overlapping kinase-like isoform X2 [Acanthaster planci]